MALGVYLIGALALYGSPARPNRARRIVKSPIVTAPSPLRSAFGFQFGSVDVDPKAARSWVKSARVTKLSPFTSPLMRVGASPLAPVDVIVTFAITFLSQCEALNATS